MKSLLISAVLGMAILCPAIAQESSEPAPAVAASPEEIQAWIKQLASDQFLTREAATENLVAAGLAAIEPLVDAMQGAPVLERDVRAVFVLKQIAMSTDPAVEEAARKALARIAALRPGTASQNAIETLANLSSIREKRALEELLALGAQSKPDPTDPFGDRYYLEIGDQWKGKDDDLRRLPFLINMTQLTLAGSNVKSEWLANVRDIPQLLIVSINRATVSDDSLTTLESLPMLRTLELKYVPVSNGCLEHLAKLKNIAIFKLYGTAITPDGAAELQGRLGKGVQIDLRLGAFLGIGAVAHDLGCRITDVRQGSAAFGAGLMLDDVIVTYNGERVFDFDGLTKLISQNRPKDQVELQLVRSAEVGKLIRIKRETDKLGIGGQQHLLGIDVTNVERESIAAFIGIQKGDVIYRVNDKPIGTTNELEQLVERTEIGQPITFELARRAEIRTIRVQLGEWD